MDIKGIHHEQAILIVHIYWDHVRGSSSGDASTATYGFCWEWGEAAALSTPAVTDNNGRDCGEVVGSDGKSGAYPLGLCAVLLDPPVAVLCSVDLNLRDMPHSELTLALAGSDSQSPYAYTSPLSQSLSKKSC